MLNRAGIKKQMIQTESQADMIVQLTEGEQKLEVRFRKS